MANKIKVLIMVILLSLVCVTYARQDHGRNKWLGDKVTPENVPLVQESIVSSLENIDMEKIIGIEGLKWIETEKDEFNELVKGKRIMGSKYRIIWESKNGEIYIDIWLFSSVEAAEEMWIVNTIFIFEPEQRMEEKEQIGNASWLSVGTKSIPLTLKRCAYVLFLRKNVECAVRFGYPSKRDNPKMWEAEDRSKEYALKIAREVDRILNLVPTIVEIKLQNKKIKAKESFTVDVIANDLDQDSLSYTYTFDNKSFSSTSNKQTFTAPSSKGKYNLHIKVEDGHGGVAEKNIEIEVK